MNKNSLITIGLVGIAGIILYQILFNFILPIALFVVLIYVLKLLIKGSDSSENATNAKPIEDHPDNSSAKNVVPIKPKKVKTVEEVKPTEDMKPTEEVKADEDEKID